MTRVIAPHLGVYPCRPPPLPARSLRGGAAALAAAAFPTCSAAKDEDPFGGFTSASRATRSASSTWNRPSSRIGNWGSSTPSSTEATSRSTASREKIKSILKLCKEYGVTPVAFGVEPFTQEPRREQEAVRVRQGASASSTSAPTRRPDSFDSLDKLCDEYKIAIAIHPHGPTGRKDRHRWWSAEVIMKAVKDHHKLIGSCLDTGHLIRMAQLGEKLDPAQQVKVMGNRNFGMHLKDHDNKRRTDVVFGTDGGVLDVPAVFKALQEVKFDGLRGIEYEANPKDPTADMKSSMKSCKTAKKSR